MFNANRLNFPIWYILLLYYLVIWGYLLLDFKKILYIS